ncbi:hypothetical protein HW132_35530 [Brasilonema sp. CT11]|nr:hypothetical protein [Brasilonema sp. CT11]
MAINRATTWLNEHYSKKAPKWLTDLKDQDVDFTKLTLDQQALIFLLDKNADKGTTFKNLVDSHGTDNWKKISEENWVKGHYKGTAKHTWRGSDYAKAPNIPKL